MNDVERIVTRVFDEEYERGLRDEALFDAVCQRVGLPPDRVVSLIVMVPVEALAR